MMTAETTIAICGIVLGLVAFPALVAVFYMIDRK